MSDVAKYLDLNAISTCGYTVLIRIVRSGVNPSIYSSNDPSSSRVSPSNLQYLLATFSSVRLDVPMDALSKSKLPP